MAWRRPLRDENGVAGLHRQAGHQFSRRAVGQGVLERLAGDSGPHARIDHRPVPGFGHEPDFRLRFAPQLLCHAGRGMHLDRQCLGSVEDFDEQGERGLGCAAAAAPKISVR